MAVCFSVTWRGATEQHCAGSNRLARRTLLVCCPGVGRVKRMDKDFDVTRMAPLLTSYSPNSFTLARRKKRR